MTINFKLANRMVETHNKKSKTFHENYSWSENEKKKRGVNDAAANFTSCKERIAFDGVTRNKFILIFCFSFSQNLKI